MNRQIRTYHETPSAGESLETQVVGQHQRVAERLAAIRKIVVVASGKGGVGKSFVAANLAAALADKGYRVGALDADINGPSLALMLGAARDPLRVDDKGVHPALGRSGCLVMSADLLLEPDSPVAWREPDVATFIWQSTLETGTVREFISDVAWGERDFLILDLPPGTDKITRIIELLPRIDLLLLVTTPSRVTDAVVQRSLSQVRGSRRITRVGIVRNMASHTCETCGAELRLYGTVRSSEAPVEPYAEIPFDPEAAANTDSGTTLASGTPIDRAIGALATAVGTLLQPGAEP